MNNIAVKYIQRIASFALVVFLSLVPTFLPTSAVAQSDAPNGLVSKDTIIAAYTPQGFKFGKATYSASSVKGYLPSWTLNGAGGTDNGSTQIWVHTVSTANGVVGSFSIDLNFPANELKSKLVEGQTAIGLVLSNWSDAHKWFTQAATESKALIDKGVANETSLSKTIGDFYLSVAMSVSDNDVTMRWYVSDSIANSGKRKASASTPQAAAPVVEVVAPTGVPVGQVSTTADAASAPSQNAGTIAGNGGYDCPPTHPIKGNIRRKDGAHIYHVPDDPYYKLTKPEACFATVADALGAGFRAPLR